MKALDLRHCILAVVLFAYVAAVNGALPGIGMPTLGQAIWLGGFAESFSHSLSIYAHDFGLPKPAPLVFGLPGALPIAVFIKAGLNMGDAYAGSCLLWLALAFWGAYRLQRHYDIPSVGALCGSAIWLTLPAVWQHVNYSMLSIGIALIPTYIYTVIAFFESGNKRIYFFFLLSIMFSVALFMDGYSFMMTCVFSAIYVTYMNIREFIRNRRLYHVFRSSCLLVSVLIAYALYTSYAGKPPFDTMPIDFFRGWGADISFLISPPKGMLVLPDLLHISSPRDPNAYFGDASVFLTTFSIFYIVLAIAVSACPYGDRSTKFVFLLVGIVALYLSLGPSFKFNALRPDGVDELMPAKYGLAPTGTALIDEYLPGFTSMRASYRWIALGLCGFWAVVVLALSGKRIPIYFSTVIIVAGLAINLPHMRDRLGIYISTRQNFFQLDNDIFSTRDDFPVGGIVAFMPYGNDFLANYLAPRLGVKTFNVGGDRNLFIARTLWPGDLKSTPILDPRDPDIQQLICSNFVSHVANLLVENQADAVAIPNINLLLAAHAWSHKPPSPIMQPFVDVLNNSGLFVLKQSPYFSVVYLSESMKSLDVTERQDKIKEADLSERAFVKVCGASAAGAKFVIGTPVAINQTMAASDCILGAGWSDPEKWGTWTDGKVAQFHLLLEREPQDDLTLTFKATAYSRTEHQIVTVYTSGSNIGSVSVVTGNPNTYHLVIPRRLVKNDDVALELHIAAPVSPKALGRSDDERQLGLELFCVRLDEQEVALPPLDCELPG